MRFALRMPVSRATTAPISSSVCRLPFISASALPSRTSATARAAASWLCAASTSGRAAMSIPAFAATARSLSAGATRMGSIRLILVASMTDCSDTSSQGCTITVLTGGSSRAAATTRSYFSWRRSGCIFVLHPDLPGRCGAPARAADLVARVEQGLDLLHPAAAVFPQRTARGHDPANQIEHRGTPLAIGRQQLRQRFQREVLMQEQHQILLPDHILEPGHADSELLVLRSDLLQGREPAFIDAAFRHAHIDHRAYAGFHDATLVDLAQELGGQGGRGLFPP